MTMGIGMIMEAKQILLVAVEGKAINDMIEGPVTARCQASIIMHTNATKVTD